MRVLYVHERYGFQGGVEQNIYDTAVALRARGHSVFLSAREGTGRDEEGFRAAFDGVEAGWDGDSPSGESIRALAQRLYCEVVYVHKVPDSRFVESLPTRKVRMIHDHDVTCPRRHKYTVWNGRVCESPVGWRCYADLAFIEKRSGGIVLKSIGKVKDEIERQDRYDRVLANSTWMADSLIANGVDRARVEVVHPVVPEIEDTATPVPDNANLLFVGQLIRGKGVDLLLKALVNVKREWRLDIAGDGNMREELEGLVKELGLSDQVKFLGWVPSTEARRLYDRARIACVPCRWPEPFGMVGVEAMRRGRPVVAFRVGGIPDWLKDQETGLLVPEQDLDGYAAAITRLLEDHQFAQRLGSNGRSIAAREFGFAAYIDDLEALLGGQR